MRPPKVLLALLSLSASASADSSGIQAPKVRLEVYDVSKWVYRIEDNPRVSIAKPVPKGMVIGEEFALKVEMSVAPGQWARRKDWSVECQCDYLIVRAPDWVHRELATSYLGGLRSLLE